jgi:predicted RNA-binding Zn-ribbon protein involved in translation (DUF1610 family)
MEINDEERREVAAQMREIMRRSPNCFLENMVVRSILDVIREGVTIGETVADLIDRPTCRSVSADQNRFECSECGFEMPIWDGDGGWMAFYFCPNCGAEVVDE